jgi:hypothetical protein
MIEPLCLSGKSGYALRMKLFFFGLAFFGPIVTESARADDAMKCHALKFDSYFVASNVKDNIRKINPDLVHPNFDGKYLLLRAELAMETLYLIASCETGEFFHEKLSGDLATYSLAGPGVDLKDGKDSTHYEWDGKSWLKGNTRPAEPATTGVPANNGAASSAPLPSATPGMKEAYQSLFAKFPATEILAICAPLDYNYNFRAHKNKTTILKYSPDLTHPNFAGSKLLVKTESIFETITLLADCKTGKFDDDFLKDHVTFQADSRLAIVNSSDTHPDLMVWSGGQWLRIADPTQAHGTIQNTLYREKAALVIAAIPNPKHLDTLRFENLKNNEQLKHLFQDLNVETIQSGKCILPRDHSPTCEIETE